MLGQDARATRLISASTALHAALGMPPHEDVVKYRQKDIAILKDRLTREAYQAAWDEGTAMSVNQAVRYAVEGRDA